MKKKPKKPGPAAMSDADRRSILIGVKVNAAEHAILSAAAAEEGLAVASYLRRLALTAARRKR